jgi:hypothetical protein
MRANEGHSAVVISYLKHCAVPASSELIRAVLSGAVGEVTRQWLDGIYILQVS